MAAPTTSTTTATSSSSATSESLGSRVNRRMRESFDVGRSRPLAWRLAQLDGLMRFLKEREDEILEALSADLGKPSFEAYGAEVGLVAGEIAHTRKNLARWMHADSVSTPMTLQPAKSRIYKDPLGVVLIIAPWNYPFQLAIGPLIGALAAGNCAVVKPSEVAPATSALIARRLTEYVDPGCVAVVEGGVPETTDLLEQRWDHIFYTGNGTVGRIVMEAAAKHLTPVILELGGKSPCIVHGDADLDVAAKRIVWGKFYNCGQTCIAPDYLLVHRAVHERFLDKMVENVRAFWGDDPQKSPDYARIVNERHHDRLTKLLESGEAVIGGHHDRSDRFIAPTILKNVSPDSPVMAEEIFGPILPVLVVDDVEEAIRFINRRPKPLALYVFSESEDVQQRVIERTSSGSLVVNHVTVQYTHRGLPFGGVGESGMGAYHGKASFESFTHHKSVLLKSSFLDPPLVYPPYTEKKKALLRRVL